MLMIVFLIKDQKLSKRNHHYLQYQRVICNLSSPVFITIVAISNNNNSNNSNKSNDMIIATTTISKTTTKTKMISTDNIGWNKLSIHLNLKTLSQTHSQRTSTLQICFHHHKLINNKTINLNNNNNNKLPINWQKRKTNVNNCHQNYSCSNFVDQSISKKHINHIIKLKLNVKIIASKIAITGQKRSKMLCPYCRW